MIKSKSGSKSKTRRLTDSYSYSHLALNHLPNPNLHLTPTLFFFRQCCIIPHGVAGLATFWPTSNCGRFWQVFGTPHPAKHRNSQ